MAAGGQLPASLSTVVLCCRYHHRNPPCHLSPQLPCAEEGAEAPSDPDRRNHNGRCGGRWDTGLGWGSPHLVPSYLWAVAHPGLSIWMPSSHLVVEQNQSTPQGPAAPLKAFPAPGHQSSLFLFQGRPIELLYLLVCVRHPHAPEIYPKVITPMYSNLRWK